MLKAAKISDLLITSWNRWRQVTTQAAKERHAAALGTLGIRVPVQAIVVEASSLSYLPLWVAFLCRGTQERLVAIDGDTGRDRAGLGHTLTANSQVVRDALRAAPH
jgi:hypothetical protein